MNELPKELTAELLSLVLGKDVKEIRWYKPNKNTLQYDVEAEQDYTELNLDTLGRLCKGHISSFLAVQTPVLGTAP